MREYEGIDNLLSGGAERRALEFKAAFAWTDQSEGGLWIRESFIRAVLAMTNLQGGGVVVVGVKQTKHELTLTGMTNAQLDTFVDDNVKDAIDSFSETPLTFEMLAGGVGPRFLVVSVEEFTSVPTICKKDGKHEQKILRVGDIYTRSKRGRPASARATSAELQELIQLAADKEHRSLVARGYTRRQTEPAESVDAATFYRNRIKDIE